MSPPSDCAPLHPFVLSGPQPPGRPRSLRGLRGTADAAPGTYLDLDLDAWIYSGFTHIDLIYQGICYTPLISGGYLFL